ncbi:MAG: fasciclin domain-containing protein [Proteobacteria bacterium]|nr:fasciclin domain-containing protein [Pseudomonadota bacterium]
MTFTLSNRASFWAVLSLCLFAVVANAEHHKTADTEHHKTADTKTLDIVDTAIGAGQFNTLAAALTAADLVATLKGEGPFTVFAPTDAAFAKLPEGTVENLLKPENRDQLIAVLTYHVVPGKVYAADVVKLTRATTVNGSDVTIAVVDGGVRIDNANVVTTDIAASNGVIHVIDAVILPN